MNKEDLNILTLIPARGGSKRLPGKNIKDLCGKPLIAWTIEEAKKSQYLDKIVVSTDSEEIAEISRKFGAEVPFIRPNGISLDETGIPAVIEHCLKELDVEFSHILLLQPTCPLRSYSDIDAAIEILLEKQANAVYSICEVDHSPLWANTLPPDLSFDNFLKPEVAGIRSQDLPSYYRLNGAIYLVSLDAYRDEKSLFIRSQTYAYVMNKKNSVDIDDQLDFIFAETILKNSK